MNILLDSFALIELFKGSKIGAEVKRIISESSGVFTTSANLYEVYYRLEELVGKSQAVEAINEILVSADSIPIDDTVALKASKLKKIFAVKGMGASDYFVLAAAKEKQAKIVSGDPHFKGFKNVVFIE